MVKFTIKPNKTVYTALIALALWIGDSAIDAFVFHQGAFTDVMLFRVSTFELYFRSLLISGFFFSTILFSRVAARRNSAVKALQSSEEKLRIITSVAKDAIVMMDDQGNISFWNPAAERIFGFTASEAIGKELHILLTPERFHDFYKEGFLRFRTSGEGASVGRTLELMAMKKDGAEFSVELSLSALQLYEKWHAVGILRDVSERKKTVQDLHSHRDELERLVTERTEELNTANELLRQEIHDRTRTEEELCRSENFLSTIFDSFHDPFSIVDRDYRLIRFNEAFTRSRDRRATDLFGKKCYEVLHSRTAVCDECVVEKTFQSKDPCAKEKKLTLPEGRETWVEIYTYPIFDQYKNVTHVVEYTRDITERKAEDAEKKQLIRTLNHLSTTDSLTGLFNRRALNDTLKHEIERSLRYNADLSLLLCDIDKFKLINDTYGHSAGDRALQVVTEAIKTTIRKADILGRYGGDEFMVILPVTTIEGAKSLAEKIRVAVENIDLELPRKKRIGLSLSIGVASCCTAMENIDTFVALADSALYSSKEAGRNTVSVAEKLSA